MIEAPYHLEETAHDANASEDDLEPDVCSLYKAIVEHMVRGEFRSIKHSYNRNIWEGLSYVPRTFLQTL